MKLMRLNCMEQRDINEWGISLRYEEWDKVSVLPLYLKGSYHFQIAYIDDRRCILLTPIDELTTLNALKKHIKKIQTIEKLPVIVRLNSISFYRKKSLIEQRIPFITKKQMFLPFMGAFLMKEKETNNKIEKFTPSTQLLFLMYLYQRKKKLYMSEASKILPYSAMTLSRSVQQLESTGLFKVSKEGVRKVIESTYSQRELFEKAKKYLISPIRKKGYMEKSAVTKDMIRAGESALSEMTMLNPSIVETYAIDAKLFDGIQYTPEFIDPDQQICIELWSYDPKQFATDKTADVLSIVLSFLENTDERIEEAIEEIIEREL